MRPNGHFATAGAFALAAAAVLWLAVPAGASPAARPAVGRRRCTCSWPRQPVPTGRNDDRT